MVFPVINRLSELRPRYDVILCDVWGVLHNGVSAWPHAVEALKSARQAGQIVILITNSPRPNAGVIEQLAGYGVGRDSFDDIVTSGDVTRTLIEEGSRRVFHLGPDRDWPIFEGLDVDLVEEFEASSVVCTGLFDDENETPADYKEMLGRMRARNLPFICANPDIVVERGDRLVYCAGALARDYALSGGRTLIAGKPHTPIYARAFHLAQQVKGSPVDRARVLAIGDGITTDVKGAMDNDVDLLFISDGIHAREYGDHGAADPARLAKFLTDFGAAPIATMNKLV